MPPASLPATPAMIPGPITARNASSPRRRNRPRRRGTGTCGSRAAIPRGAAITASRSPRPMVTGRRLPRARTRAAAAAPGGGRDRVDRVVDRDDADEPALVVDHGHGQQVVVGDGLGDRLGRLQGAHRDGLVDHHLGDPRLGPGDDQVAEREHADEAAVVVDDVHVVDGLGVRLELAQPVDGLRRGERRGHRRRTRSSSGRPPSPRGTPAGPGPPRPRRAPSARGSRRGCGRTGRPRGPPRRPGSSPRGCRPPGPARGPRAPRPGCRAPSPRPRRPGPRRRARRGRRGGRAA